MQYCFHFDDQGFLRDLDGKNLVWISAHLRSDEAVGCGGVIIFGGGTSAMTLLYDLYSESVAYPCRVEHVKD